MWTLWTITKAVLYCNLFVWLVPCSRQIYAESESDMSGFFKHGPSKK